MSATKKIDELYGLIDGIEIAMFTTRREDGHLVSRPMATQHRVEGADLWFVTDLTTNKLEELRFDSHVNVSYYRDRTREWVSVSGIARVSQDRGKIQELWRPDWRAWFPGEGENSGTPEDPRIALILVDADSVVYMVNNKPAPLVLFEVARGILTGKTPDVGSVRHVSQKELAAHD